MKKSIYHFLTITAVALMLGACAAARTTMVHISGPLGEPFTVHYRTGARSGSIRTVTQTEGPTGVLMLRTIHESFQCELSKSDPEIPLVIEVKQGRKPTYRAEAPSGVKGVRISNTPTGWNHETF